MYYSNTFFLTIINDKYVLVYCNDLKQNKIVREGKKRARGGWDGGEGYEV